MNPKYIYINEQVEILKRENKELKNQLRQAQEKLQSLSEKESNEISQSMQPWEIIGWTIVGGILTFILYGFYLSVSI